MSMITKTLIAVVGLSVLTTSVMAQDGRRGDGQGRRDNTEARGGNSGDGGGRNRPVVTPPPVVIAEPERGNRFGGWGGWGGWGRTNTPGIDQRQAEQAVQIARGQRNGSLTASEARDLRAEQARIAELERRAKADGNVTREERMQLRNQQELASRHIAQESFDREREGGHRRNRWWW